MGSLENKKKDKPCFDPFRRAYLTSFLEFTDDPENVGDSLKSLRTKWRGKPLQETVLDRALLLESKDNSD